MSRLNDISHVYDVDPEYLRTFERKSGPLGSNPGGMFTDPAGRSWYLKQYQGANAVDRTKNEKLATAL